MIIDWRPEPVVARRLRLARPHTMKRQSGPLAASRSCGVSDHCDGDAITWLRRDVPTESRGPSGDFGSALVKE